MPNPSSNAGYPLPQPSSNNSSNGYAAQQQVPQSNNTSGYNSGYNNGYGAYNGVTSTGSHYSSTGGGVPAGAVPPPPSMQPGAVAFMPPLAPGYQPQGAAISTSGGFPLSLGSNANSSGNYSPGHMGLLSSGASTLPIGQHQLSNSGVPTSGSYGYGSGGLGPQSPGATGAVPMSSPNSHNSANTYGQPFSSSGPPLITGFTATTNGLSSGMRSAAAASQQGASIAAAALANVQGQQVAMGGLMSAVARPQLGDDLYCSCPMVCVVGTNHGAPHAVPLDIVNLQFTAHCHISQAFVDLQLICQYPANWNDAPLVFFLPKTTDTTITELCIENMVRPSVFATAIVPLEDMKKYSGTKGAGGGYYAPGSELDEQTTDPEMFMLPLPPGLPGDQYRVKLSFFHPMLFDMQQGKYVLRLPTTIPQACLSRGSSVNSVLDVNVTLNTGIEEEVDLLCPSHSVLVKGNDKGTVSLELDTKVSWDNTDFVVGYGVWRDHLTATVHAEPPTPGLPDQRGTFALSITPPGPEQCVAFPRSVVFLFDRSGSMTGDPIRYAKAALLTGLQMLGPQDQFTVVAFDHEQLWWTDHLIPATRDAIVQCMTWVNDDLSARGTTDIKSPLMRALTMLSGAPGLPFVFLLTDGCVDDERDICQMAETAIANACKPIETNNIMISMDGSAVRAVNPTTPAAPTPLALAPRIYTFGIGPFCNHYFLKRLAAIGRGMNDVAFRPHAIQSVMERMLAAAALPMLSDVQIIVPGLKQVELFPFPIPDVFVGQMLLVSGKFEGDWPETVDISGTLPDGSSWSQTVPSLPADNLPLHKVFIKSQLDHMTANPWMAGNPPNLVQQIVDLSMATGVVSAHTTMLGFETTPEKYQQMQAVPPTERRKRIVKWAVGGAAGVALVAGVAAALTFGDLASTLANMPVGDAMAAMGGDLGGFFEGLGDAFDCCGGGCDCCADCGDLCGACLTC